MTKLLRSIALCAALCVSTTAAADVFFDTYQRGLAAFKARSYPAARADFLRAYELRPEPIILFNVAQTYRLEQNAEQALVYYRRFLAEPRIAEELRAEAQRHVTDLTNLEAERAAREARKRQEAAAGPRERDGSPVRVATPPTEPRVSAPSTVLPHAQSEPRRDAPRDTRRRRIPLGSQVALGIGAAGLTSAVVVGLLGLRAERELKQDPMANQSDADRVERYQTAINVSWGITGVALATAVALYFATPAYSTDRKAIVLAPHPEGGFTAAVAGRF